VPCYPIAALKRANSYDCEHPLPFTMALATVSIQYCGG
jgi:hypothetical protein